MVNRPNILLLLSDEHHYRFLSQQNKSNDSEPVHTPTLDSIAKSGTQFEQSYCQSPLCTPSRISMLTGREPQRCGAWNNNSVLRPGMSTLPGTLSEAGYETSLVGKMHLGGDRQFVGFDNRPYGDMTGKTGHQIDPIAPSSPERKHGGVVQPSRQGAEPLRTRTADAGVTTIPESQLQEQNVTRETVSFLREHDHANPDVPWFMCASFSRPHFPLTAPRRYFERYWPDGVTEPRVWDEGDTRSHPFTESVREGFRTDEIDDEELLRARAAYFACVDYLDEILGDLLGMLDDDGLLEDTVVIYTSDHGELAGEHGLWWKHTWHEAATRVPLIFQTPAQRKEEQSGLSIAEPVSLCDLFPTICGLVDVEIPDDVDGMDLSESVRTGEDPNRDTVFCDNLVPRWGEGTEFRVARDGRYKYVRFRNMPELLFDINADPCETTNLAPNADGEDAEALERLRNTVDDSIDFEDVEMKRKQQEEENSQFKLSIPKGTNGNTYLLPDGRLVDAETMLYKPDILTPNPEAVFPDWPESQ